MVETAGTKLRQARIRRGLTIEDAARGTKIRPAQIADIEADEYSNFANLAYARGFFVGYAKYLHVDVRSYLEAFEDTSTFGLDDYQYLRSAPIGVYRVPSRPSRPLRRRRKHGILALTSISGLVACAVMGWFITMSYWRLGGDLDRLAARQEARERAARQGTPPGETKPPMSAPSVREGTIPVSAPVTQSPAPSAPPATEKTVVTAATLAAADNANAVPVGTLKSPAEANPPAMPLPDDGAAARAVAQGAGLRAVSATSNGRENPAAGQSKIRVLKAQPGTLTADTYPSGLPQPVANNTVR